MNISDKYSQNEFLIKWIHGTLSTEEFTSFRNSKLYRNLVSSKEVNKTLYKSLYNVRL